MNMVGHLGLSQTDFENWLNALAQLPQERHEFMPWIEGPLKRFFPFSHFFCAHGELLAGRIQITHWTSSGHDEAYLHQLENTFELDMRGSLARWFVARDPFIIDPDAPPAFATPFEIEEIRNFGLKNVAAHGVLNAHSNAGTYFSFAGLAAPLSNWHRDALRLIAPVLNDLFLSAIARPSDISERLIRLTGRQTDIVRELAAGMDDKSISRKLGIAEKTVRNQLSDIYARLGINKRTQLLALLR